MNRAKHRRAHLIGVAGSGMQALLQVLQDQGWALSGSDRSLLHSDNRFYCRHNAANLPDNTDLVIYSAAIPLDNPERIKAQQLGIPQLSYSEMPGSIMARRTGLLVAGTHGKSTTTAITAHILLHADKDPTVVCGAATIGQNSGGRSGSGEWMLAEACEYRENFRFLKPRHAIITNIELDHVDCFADLSQVQAAFARFVANISSEGTLVLGEEVARIPQITAHRQGRIETFGFSIEADWRLAISNWQNGRYEFTILHQGKPLLQASFGMLGRHNLLNALAAVAICHASGVSPSLIAAALASFPGVCRRMEVIDCGGRMLIDDFAHHHSEIAANLSALGELFPNRRIYCIFQPHQLSRTRHFLGELGESLQNVDRLLVADVYTARETPGKEAALSAALAARLTACGVDANAISSRESLLGQVTNDLNSGRLQPTDIVITMGAGDIRKITHGIAERIRTHCSRKRIFSGAHLVSTGRSG